MNKTEEENPLVEKYPLLSYPIVNLSAITKGDLTFRWNEVIEPKSERSYVRNVRVIQTLLSYSDFNGVIPLTTMELAELCDLGASNTNACLSELVQGELIERRFGIIFIIDPVFLTEIKRQREEK